MKSSTLTLGAGIALIVPASLGLLLSGTPTIFCPFPTLTILASFLLGKTVAVLGPSLLFLAWNPSLFHGQLLIPKRSVVLLGFLMVLSGLYFFGSWKYGMQYQGSRFTHAVCFANIVWLLLLWALTFWRLSKPSFAANL